MFSVYAYVSFTDIDVCVCWTVGNGGLYHSSCRLTSPSLSNGCQAAHIARAEREIGENEHERERLAEGHPTRTL